MSQHSSLSVILLFLLTAFSMRRETIVYIFGLPMFNRFGHPLFLALVVPLLMCVALSATLFSRRHMSTACGWPLGYFLGTVIAGWHVVGLMATFCVPLWQGACLARCLLGVDLSATFVSRSCPTMVRTLGVLFVACLSAWLGPCLGPSIQACSLGVLSDGFGCLVSVGRAWLANHHG